MKQRKIIFLIIFILTLSFLLCGCSKRKVDEEEWMDIYNLDNYKHCTIDICYCSDEKEDYKYKLTVAFDDNIAHIKYNESYKDGDEVIKDNDDYYCYLDENNTRWVYEYDTEDNCWYKYDVGIIGFISIEDFISTDIIGTYDEYTYDMDTKAYVKVIDDETMKIGFKWGKLNFIQTIYDDSEGIMNFEYKDIEEIELPSDAILFD